MLPIYGLGLTNTRDSTALESFDEDHIDALFKNGFEYTLSLIIL